MSVEQFPSLADVSTAQLDYAIKQAADGIVLGETQDPQAGVRLAELVREQHRRQAGAKRRIGEFLRQKALTEGRKGQYRDEDLIDVHHTDPWAYPAGLRYSDIEAVVPVLERDSQAEFFAIQQRRLRDLLATKPKLNDAQRGLLEAIASAPGMSYSAGLVDAYYNAPGSGRVDGRALAGLVRRKLVDGKSGGSGRHSGILMIAKVDEQ